MTGMQPIANDGFVATHRRLDQAASTIVMRLLPSDPAFGGKLEEVPSQSLSGVVS